MIVLWIGLIVGGLTVSGIASGRALRSAEALGHAAGLSPFVIGLTIMSVGTDLPEIANSISAAIAGRGDLNVGDSTGSAATQITFVLGLLMLMSPMTTRRSFVATSGFWTVGALLIGAALMSDGEISRFDGLVLVLLWLAGTVFVGWTSRNERTAQPDLFAPSVGSQVVRTLVSLAAVGAGAVAAVQGFGQVTDQLGVPDYVTSFFVLSIGTSLPELLVDGRALRRGNGSLALGDILGSSLVDATLSLGIGPLIIPTDVSSASGRGTLLVAGVVALAVCVLLARTRHRWASGIMLVALYVLLYPLLLAS